MKEISALLIGAGVGMMHASIDRMSRKPNHPHMVVTGIVGIINAINTASGVTRNIADGSIGAVAYLAAYHGVQTGLQKAFGPKNNRR